jgi:uncharacterized membrane protein YcaP (DUF421 family)
MRDLLGIILRISVIYLYALAAVRLSGKRGIKAIAPFDVVVGALLGDLFDDIFLGETALAEGIVAITTVIVLHLLMSYASYRSTRFAHLVGSRRTILAREGRAVEAGLRHERMRQEDLQVQLRQHGVEQMDEVRELGLEPSGQTSVLLYEAAKPADQRDLPALREQLR